MAATNKTNSLQYKGFPLLRKDNVLYYGSMSDSHIIMMQILETREEKGIKIATRVSVQLQLTDKSLRAKERIVKSTEKSSLWNAMDIASIWLKRANSSK